MSEREYMDSCQCSYEEYQKQLAETQKHLAPKAQWTPPPTPEQNFAAASRLFQEASKDFKKTSGIFGGIKWFR